MVGTLDGLWDCGDVIADGQDCAWDVFDGDVLAAVGGVYARADSDDVVAEFPGK